MHALEERLKLGGTVILDGATGTELERRGVPMHGDVWCGVATLSHGDVLRQVHADYIRVGADVITANTYASSRNMLGPAGLGDKVARVTTRAVELALEARDAADAGREVWVAGSMSTMMPIVAGGDRRDPAQLSPSEGVAANFRETAELLAGAGVDLIIMEMMSDPALAVPAIRAAAETGLPVWVGLSCRSRAAGAIVSHARAELLFADAVRGIVAAGGSVAGVMHTSIEDATPALDILKDHWTGPLMAYPESGYFEMPNWRFVDIVSPDDFAAQGALWADAGVQVLGGCCGIGVEHIARLGERLSARAQRSGE